MIIKKPIAANTVISFRLTTGETLIARFVERTETHLVITKPVTANPIQNEQGFGIYYTPFCATVEEDETFRIPSSAVLFEPIHPREELSKSYQKMTSGLELPR